MTAAEVLGDCLVVDEYVEEEENEEEEEEAADEEEASMFEKVC
jgi:hypothetical protein